MFSKKWEEHLQWLEGVFECLLQAKLELGAAKCTLAAPEVRCLGHSDQGWSSTGPFSAAGNKRDYPPQNVKELRSFLELASYYQWYVNGFAAIAPPLHKLTKKDIIYHWTPECQEAFLQLKHLLTVAPEVAFPDFVLLFQLYIDTSNLGLGAISAQVARGA